MHFPSLEGQPKKGSRHDHVPSCVCIYMYMGLIFLVLPLLWLVQRKPEEKRTILELPQKRTHPYIYIYICDPLNQKLRNGSLLLASMEQMGMYPLPKIVEVGFRGASQNRKVTPLHAKWPASLGRNEHPARPKQAEPPTN